MGPARSVSPTALTARKRALNVLSRLRRTGAFAAPIIAETIDGSDLPRRDRDFAATLVKGVVTYQGVLDEALDRFLTKPSRVAPDLRESLRLSAYELLILKTPAHAAVDQGVRLAATVAPRARGLANAVLRRLAEVAADFPFGDPATDDEAAARACALPLWLFQLIAAERGRAAAYDFGRASLESAPLFFAVRDDRVLTTLRQLGVTPIAFSLVEDIPPRCYRLPSASVLQDPAMRGLLAEEALVVADGASQVIAALALGDDCPASFLEIGAGRGTKTLLLASDATSWGAPLRRSVAIDDHPGKLNVARKRCETAGFSGIEFITADATKLDEVLGPDETFDGIFIDAPCSGIGTCRRHPEIRWRITPETIDAKAALGLKLLTAAAYRLRPGATLTYATCTITRRENEDVLERFLASPSGAAFDVLPTLGANEFSTLGLDGLDAHMAFRLRRRDVSLLRRDEAC